MFEYQRYPKFSGGIGSSIVGTTQPGSAAENDVKTWLPVAVISGHFRSFEALFWAVAIRNPPEFPGSQVPICGSSQLKSDTKWPWLRMGNGILEADEEETRPSHHCGPHDHLLKSRYLERDSRPGRDLKWLEVTWHMATTCNLYIQNSWWICRIKH